MSDSAAESSDQQRTHPAGATEGGEQQTADLHRLLGAGTRTPAQQLVLDTDWSATAAGDPAGWSGTLQAAVGTAMTSRFPMLVMAGPELVMVYNDAYAPLLGDRHPGAMGRPLGQVWADVWPTIAPMIDTVWDTQEGNYFEDLLLVTSRRGFEEETYFTFSYSPLLAPEGRVVGLLDTAVETTGRVLAARRLALAQQLGQVGVTRHQTLHAATAEVASVLAGHRADLPVAALFLLQDVADPDSLLVRAAAHGLPVEAMGEAGRAWLRTALTCGEQMVTGLNLSWPGWDRATAQVGGGAVDSAVALPLLPAGRDTPVGVLLLGLSPHLAWDEAYRVFVRSVAAQTAGVLGDTLTHLAEVRALAAARSMAEALQRSLLTDPAVPDGLQVVARYLPAASEAEIGGDWYDCFRGRDGATWLVVGDVAGHDQAAAAVMGQVRNLLRGITYTSPASPAAVLAALDQAMEGLGVTCLTSVVAARLEPSVPGRAGGGRRVRWSNAGHLPPVLLPATGGVQVLDTRPEAVLGADVTTRRSDHELVLSPGDGLMFYTDGLIERRGADLDAGTTWLTGALKRHPVIELDELCDELLAQVSPYANDDIALLAIRARGAARSPS